MGWCGCGGRGGGRGCGRLEGCPAEVDAVGEVGVGVEAGGGDICCWDAELDGEGCQFGLLLLGLSGTKG